MLTTRARSLSRNLAIYLRPRMIVVLVLGFASGLPFSLTGSTLQVWMTKANVDLRIIGKFSLIGLPYLLKVFWSPAMDRFVPPWLGRRRGWIILVQLVLMGAIAGLAFASPGRTLAAFTVLAFFVAFSSASQDIVIDAYRTDLLTEEERGPGSGLFVVGWRIGAVISGAAALILSDSIGWRNTYLVMAACMVLGLAGAVCAPEPDAGVSAPRTMRDAVLRPLEDFFARRGAVVLLCAIILYKLGDAYATSLTSAFLVRAMDFSSIEIGAIYKGFGFVATLVGASLGGSLMLWLGLYRSLFYFGILQLISNLSFMVFAWVGKSYGMLVFCVAFENFAAAMATAALFAFLMSLCNKQFSATQYALLSSLASLGRVVGAPSAGYVVLWLGWPHFFLISGMAAVPGLAAIYLLRDRIEGLMREGRA